MGGCRCGGLIEIPQGGTPLRFPPQTPPSLRVRSIIPKIGLDRFLHTGAKSRLVLGANLGET